MTKCSNCGEELKNNNDQSIDSKSIDSKSFATTLKDGRIVCVACADIISLMEDLPTKKIKKTVVKDKKIIKSKNEFICINTNCKKTYTGSVCPYCKTINPLFIRTNKKKKKKKKILNKN